MSKTDRRWIIFMEMLRGTTISSTGTDVTISCSSHDLKDDVMEMLGGDSLGIERRWITAELERQITAARRQL